MIRSCKKSIPLLIKKNLLYTIWIISPRTGENKDIWNHHPENLKIQDTEGGWAGTPSCFWGASETKNGSKITCFLKKHCPETLFMSVFLLLSACCHEKCNLESVGVYDALMHVFSQNTVLPVLLRRWSNNTGKDTVPDMLCCESVANSGVFLRLLFWLLQNIVNTNVLARFWGFRVRKHRKIAQFCSW